MTQLCIFVEVAEVLPSFSRPIILHNQIRVVHEHWYLIHNKAALNLCGTASSSRRTRTVVLWQFDSRRLSEYAAELPEEDR